jgi:hypothetical protein
MHVYMEHVNPANGAIDTIVEVAQVFCFTTTQLNIVTPEVSQSGDWHLVVDAHGIKSVPGPDDVFHYNELPELTDLWYGWYDDGLEVVVSLDGDTASAIAIDLQSADASALAVPAQVTIGAGAHSGPVPVTVRGQQLSAPVLLTATWNGKSVHASVQPRPVACVEPAKGCGANREWDEALCRCIVSRCRPGTCG